jgi:hypothetical protein
MEVVLQLTDKDLSEVKTSFLLCLNFLKLSEIFWETALLYIGKSYPHFIPIFTLFFTNYS